MHRLLNSLILGELPILEVLRVAQRIVSELVGGRQMARADQLPHLRPHLVEQLPQRSLTPATHRRNLGRLLVHLHISGEGGRPAPPDP